MVRPFAAAPPAAEHDPLLAHLRSLRIHCFDGLHTPAGLALAAPLPAEYLVSDASAEAAAALVLSLPVDRVWPQDTESAPGIFRPPDLFSRLALTVS